MSSLVAGKADEITKEIDALLANSHNWDDALTRCPNGHEFKAKELIVALAMQGRADWWRRVETKIAEFPLQLLLIVAKPANEACPKRREMAQRFLKLELCCLMRMDGKHSSFNEKFRILFAEDLQIMQTTGKATLFLFLFMLQFSFVIRCNTSSVESFNSIIQIMATRARNMGIALASDRLSLKVGRKVLVSDCVAVHSEAVALKKSEENSQRFSPLELTDSVFRAPPPLPLAVAPDHGVADVEAAQRMPPMPEPEVAADADGPDRDGGDDAQDADGGPHADGDGHDRHGNGCRCIHHLPGGFAAGWPLVKESRAWIDFALGAHYVYLFMQPGHNLQSPAGVAFLAPLEHYA